MRLRTNKKMTTRLRTTTTRMRKSLRLVRVLKTRKSNFGLHIALDVLASIVKFAMLREGELEILA